MYVLADLSRQMKFLSNYTKNVRISVILIENQLNVILHFATETILVMRLKLSFDFGKM